MSISQQLLKEFLDNCREGDLIKARLVLSHCDEIDTASQKRILYELNKCEDRFALPLMMFISVRHRDALARFPMLSESIRERSALSPVILKEQLFAATPEQIEYVTLVGRLNLRDTIPWLIQMLETEPGLAMQECIIQALGNLEATTAVVIISACLNSKNQAVVDSAIDALGRIATTSAIDVLNQLLVSKEAHVRNRAKYRLVALGGKAAERVSGNLLTSDVDLQIHSLNILQAIKSENSVAPVRQLIHSSPADANVRFAAYEALARLPVRKGDYVLAAGLTDADDSIRLAAARAVDQHLDDSLLRGVQNLLNPGDEDATRVARAIVDSQSDSLWLGLLENRFFNRFFIDYISTSLDSSLRSFYTKQLHRSGFASLLEEVEKAGQAVAKTATKGQICAVDDSRMILKVYQSILSELSFEPLLFEEPAEFLTWLKNNQPDAVFTDLNMPDITGIELIESVRKQYSSTELPITMVTTQNEQADIDAAYAAGVNSIISKPFDLKKIKTALESYPGLVT